MAAPASDKPSFKVIIIGAGLAGSLLANGLIHHNVDVAVYERLERHSKREGYQIRLGLGALTGMRACLTKPQVDAIVARFGRAGGLKSGAPVIYDKHFRTWLDLSMFPTYHKSAPINRGLLRDLLADPVFDAGRLHWGKQFDRFEIVNAGEAGECVRVWLQDGTHDDCDLLIGADGSHSKVNEQLGLNNLVQTKTHVSFISKNELPTAKFMAMDPAVRGKPVMTHADGKAMYFCAYLPDKVDATGNGTASEVDDELSSSMFGCHIPVEDCPDDIFERSQDEKWEFLQKQFSGWAPEYDEILSLVKGTDVYVYRARASKPVSVDWREKVRAQSQSAKEHAHARVWLLGDAMHAMLPLRGMGGNQSLWDAATVLPLVTELSKSVAEGKTVTTKDVAAKLKAYEAEMIPRAFHWVKMSGGQHLVSSDTSTWQGVMKLRILRVVMNVAYLWSRVQGLFSKHVYVDEVPELRE